MLVRIQPPREADSDDDYENYGDDDSDGDYKDNEQFILW